MRERKRAGRTEGEMFGEKCGFVKQVESFLAASTSEAASVWGVYTEPGWSQKCVCLKLSCWWAER